MADYIDHPRTHNVEYDIALVDGRARTHCVIEAMKILRHGGVVVLHDAQRVQYHESIRSVGDVKFLEPYVQGQIAHSWETVVTHTDNQFHSLADAQHKLDAWKHDYNEHRPHSALGHLTPNEYVAEHMNQDASTAPDLQD